MDRLELLLELIKSKESLSKDDVISISLGEIAEVWDRKNVVHERNLPPAFEQFFGHDYIDPGFLTDVVLALEKLTEEKKITFEKLGRTDLENSISSVSRLSHIGSIIYLKLGKSAKLPGWFNPNNISICFKEFIYKPSKGPQANMVTELIARYQEENKEGKVTKKGERILEKELAKKVGLETEEFKAVKKQLARNFKDRGFPLKVDSNAKGILLICTK